MALSDSFLQELKMKTDIEDVISTYETLKRRGATQVGLCPFHNEKTPSFTVYPATQSFYCFGCGAGGDAITFLKKIENLDYLDAVKTLAQRAGLQMPQEGFDDSLSKRRRRILEMNREAARFYHSVLLSPEGKVGYDYYMGKVVYSVPVLGRVLAFFFGLCPQSVGRIAQVYARQGLPTGRTGGRRAGPKRAKRVL